MQKCIGDAVLKIHTQVSASKSSILIKHTILNVKGKEIKWMSYSLVRSSYHLWKLLFVNPFAPWANKHFVVLKIQHHLQYVDIIVKRSPNFKETNSSPQS